MKSTYNNKYKKYEKNIDNILMTNTVIYKLFERNDRESLKFIILFSHFIPKYNFLLIPIYYSLRVPNFFNYYFLSVRV